MTTENEGRVYFSLRGDFEPDELTEFLGIEPSRSARAGERDAEKMVPKCSNWSFRYEMVTDGDFDVYALSKQVVTSLRPHQARIAEAVAKWDLAATLQVVIYFSSDDQVSTPAIGFEPLVIDFLSSVGASIDIDTYFS